MDGRKTGVSFFPHQLWDPEKNSFLSGMVSALVKQDELAEGLPHLVAFVSQSSGVLKIHWSSVKSMRSQSPGIHVLKHSPSVW
jgi:hypothetical protein